MVYSAIIGVILYWKPYQTFFIHRAHHVWFNEYNYLLSIEYKHNPGYLLLQQYPESNIHNSDLLNLITCELDLKSTPFCDTKTIIYEIELPTSGKNIGPNLLDDEDFTIPHIIDTISISPYVHQLPTQANKNCGSLISMDKRLSQLKALLMNLISIKIHVENPRSISVYIEGRATRGKILKRFGPYFIKSYLWFHMLKLVSQINLSPQRTLVKL